MYQWILPTIIKTPFCANIFNISWAMDISQRSDIHPVSFAFSIARALMKSKNCCSWWWPEKAGVGFPEDEGSGSGAHDTLIVSYLHPHLPNWSFSFSQFFSEAQTAIFLQITVLLFRVLVKLMLYIYNLESHASVALCSPNLQICSHMQQAYHGFFWPWRWHCRSRGG